MVDATRVDPVELAAEAAVAVCVVQETAEMVAIVDDLIVQEVVTAESGAVVALVAVCVQLHLH